MANYITKTDLYELLADDVIRQLTDDLGDGDVDDPRVTQCIVGAQSEVDGYVSRRYTLPLDPAPQLVKEITAQLTAYRLFLRRQRVPESFKELVKEARDMLEKIGEGKILLETGDEDDPTRNEGGTFQVTSKDRVHTRTKWADW